jgi:hypothetical protein
MSSNTIINNYDYDRWTIVSSDEEKNNNKDKSNEDNTYDTYTFGEEHQNTDFTYYDIKYINFKKFIKHYNGNRIINPTHVNEIVVNYIKKPFFIPPLIVYYINDDKNDIHDYILLDGQHRFEALKVLHSKNINPIFTYIMLSGTLDQAKEEFKNINSNVKLSWSDLCAYEKPAELILKITQYFKNFVSTSDSPQSHKFNSVQLKEELIKNEFFKKISNTVDMVFNEIKILNQQIYNHYSNLVLPTKQKKLFDRIKNQDGNKMYLLMDKEWLIKLIAKLEN